MSSTKIEQARALRPIIENAISLAVSDNDALNAVPLFPSWSSDGRTYQIGDRVKFEGKLYKCVQQHNSQEGWTPYAASSLWARMDDPSEEWPQWVQPTGAHDAYDIGAKVSYDGKHWVCTMSANVYQPGVYGWDEVTE